MKKTAILFGLLLAGCTTEKPITWADGGEAHMIKCDGALQSFANCLEQAGATCPHGYAVLAKNGESAPYLVVDQYGGEATEIVRRSLAIRCK